MFVPTDLHAHTYHSDGKATPGELVRARKQAGVRLMAISDHDIFTASRAGFEEASAHGLGFLAAAEVTSVLHFGTPEAEQVHVLAYFPASVFEPGRLESRRLFVRGLELRERWKWFVLQWIHDLPPFERSLLLLGLERVPPREFPGLQRTLDHLAQKRPSLIDTFRRHHVKFWLEDKNLFGWSPEEMIEEIRADGAIDVVAHAVRYRDRARTQKILEMATGVEVYTSRHGPKYSEELLDFARTHKKLWTASTDDHQKDPYTRPPAGTPLETVQALMGAPVPTSWISDA